MGNSIQVEEIMQELRNNVKKRSYPKEALDFNSVRAQKQGEEDLDFFEELMERDISYMNHSSYVEYDRPITGRGPRIKRIIKNLYQFHLRPLWDAQNCFNLKAASAMTQLRNFVLQQMKDNEQTEKQIEELRQSCREQQIRLERLEKKLSEEKG